MQIKKILVSLLFVVIAMAAFTGGFMLVSYFCKTESFDLKLRGDREVFVECNRPYIEAGAYAIFKNGDGSLQVPVNITGDTVDTGKIGTYLLKYTALYDGHVATSYRRVRVGDTEKPEITLKGAAEYFMNVGQPYEELGYTATDNCDGDLSDQVHISGEVDRFTPGEYALTYTVTDSNGNTASVTRTAYVQQWDVDEEVTPYIGKSNGKVIYLTFDDGPGKNTPRLLDMLKKYNIKATFFVVNTGYISTIRRIAEEGHTLAMHTMSHVYKEIYANEEAYFKDLYAIQNIIKEQTGQESKILRFPGGSSNRSSSFNPGIMTRLTKLVEEEGFVYFDWTVDSKDSVGARTPEEVFQNVASGVLNAKKDYSIILQHDIKRYSVDAVETIILWGLANGYTFLPIDENTPVCHHTVRN